jgi:hypothetical protein
VRSHDTGSARQWVAVGGAPTSPTPNSTLDHPPRVIAAGHCSHHPLVSFTPIPLIYLSPTCSCRCLDQRTSNKEHFLSPPAHGKRPPTGPGFCCFQRDLNGRKGVCLSRPTIAAGSQIIVTRVMQWLACPALPCPAPTRVLVWIQMCLHALHPLFP